MCLYQSLSTLHNGSLAGYMCVYQLPVITVYKAGLGRMWGLKPERTTGMPQNLENKTLGTGVWPSIIKKQNKLNMGSNS